MSRLAVALLAAALAAPDLPSDRIATALEHFAVRCRADAGTLWGISLCGRVLVADFDAGRLYSSDPDPAGSLTAIGGPYAGPLPADLPRANTGVDWQGQRWTQVLWPLPDDEDDRMRLLLHESFHRIQPALGLISEERSNPHLDETDGRLWIRLEWRALAAALSGEDWRLPLADALAFRRQRYQLIESARAAEWALERNEGLAEYTGVRLAYAHEAATERAAETLRQADGWEHLPRRFAYASGPAWGLLLDRLVIDWRRRVLAGDDFLKVAEQAMDHVAAQDDRAVYRRATVYGLAEVEVQENELAQARETVRADLRAQLLGPEALALPLAEAQMSFDPRAVTALPPDGTVYRGLTLQDRWGRIEVGGPALISADFTVLRVSAVTESGLDRLAGADWQLTLDPHWEYVRCRVTPRAPSGQ